MRMDVAVAAIRQAVREDLADLVVGDLVLVAISGGADSLALAAAVAAEAPRSGLRAGAVTVDHGLQEGSARRATDVAAACLALGLAPAIVETVEVGRAARKRRLVTRATRRWTPPPIDSMPARSCSATRSMIRRRRCCWAWPEAPARGRSPACRRDVVGSDVRCSACVGT
jgi:tRNA(Ile)-lysidine synthase TilS/MesJ